MLNNCTKCGAMKLVLKHSHQCNGCGSQYCNGCFSIIRYKEGRNWIGECVKCHALVK